MKFSTKIYFFTSSPSHNNLPFHACISTQNNITYIKFGMQPMPVQQTGCNDTALPVLNELVKPL